MIPDYQAIMLPLLKLISNGKEYKMRDVTEELAKQLGVTEEERKELLPSGAAPVFYNRTAWAKTYLKKAGLIDSPKQGFVIITPRGIQVIKSNPSSIDVKFLKQFSEFIEFQSAKREDEQSNIEGQDDNAQTPEEALETAYQKIRKTIAQDLINKVLTLSPAFLKSLWLS